MRIPVIMARNATRAFGTLNVPDSSSATSNLQCVLQIRLSRSGISLANFRRGRHWRRLDRLHEMGGMGKVVFSSSLKYDVFGRTVGVPRRQGDQAEEDPEERHPLNYERRELCNCETRNPYVRTPGRNGCRFRVQKCIGKNGCANEADERREAHQNIEELLDPVYEGHDETRIFHSIHMVVLSLASFDEWNHPVDLPERDRQKLKSCRYSAIS